MMRHKKPLFLGLFVLINLLVIPLVKAEEVEICLSCHRYSGLGCFDELTGDKRIFYLNEDLFHNTVHGKLRCLDCHQDVKETPHQTVSKVDCGVNCHLKDPSTNEDFSHQPVVQKFKAGVHARSIKNQKQIQIFFNETGSIKCKYCHPNPLYFSEEEAGCGGLALLENSQIDQRCTSCHPKKDWAKWSMQHLMSHTKSKRSHQQTVTMCNTCHADKYLMQQFDLESTDNFRNCFHYRNVKFETHNAADCLSCHAPAALGYSIHSVNSAHDPNSPLWGESRTATCSQKSCHPNPTELFVKGKIHPPNKITLLSQGKPQVDNARRRRGSDNTKNSSQEQKIKSQILWWVKLFYKCLIFLLGGFMSIHQALDIRKSFSSRKLTSLGSSLSMPSDEAQIYYQRLTKEEIWQHLLLASAFIMLVLTGMMSLLPESWIISIFGQSSGLIYTIRRILHLFFAGLIISTGCWHVVYVLFSTQGQVLVRDMIPRLSDLIHLKENFYYFLGLKKNPPLFDRFTYQEKLEYITGSMGMVIITITGTIMVFASRFPHFWVDIAATVHLMEAVLATMAISIWHLFSVHWKPGKFPFDHCWLDGKISLVHLHEEHPRQYEKIMLEMRKQLSLTSNQDAKYTQPTPTK